MTSTDTRLAVSVPQLVLDRLSIDDASDADAIELLSSGSDGWAHVAHLSVGEVLVDGDGRLRVALWEGSATANAVWQSGRAVLLLPRRNELHELRCSLERTATLALERPRIAFLLTLVEVRDKRAPYAQVQSGLRFAYRNPAAAIAEWREVRHALATADFGGKA